MPLKSKILTQVTQYYNINNNFIDYSIFFSFFYAFFLTKSNQKFNHSKNSIIVGIVFNSPEDLLNYVCNCIHTYTNIWLKCLAIQLLQQQQKKKEKKNRKQKYCTELPACLSACLDACLPA